jgi:hypothetical protein
VVQLADLDRECKNQRDDVSQKKRATSQDQTHDQKQHQRPQNIAAAFTNERWQMLSVPTRSQTN